MIATRPERLPGLAVRQIVRYVNLILRLVKSIAIILETQREIEGHRP